ncbi:MAG TPA: helix-turn-helix transcriptional regulator [Phenylobacterium sp.]|jgi:transcriptional regulator with XRE-family HTH domain|nr:helix-turn-helix transcriptional regulator [Phenylobacterium sp.]
MLKRWREARGLSQLDLALQAEISARHLSYVETGRSQPSREMICPLAEVMAASAADRNDLLLAAGYAPMTGPRRTQVLQTEDPQSATDLILLHHEPYPAIVLDACWNVRASNLAAKRFRRLMTPEPSSEMNMLRLMIDPREFRPRIIDWEDAVGDLLRQLRRQMAGDPGNAEMRRLLSDVIACPGAPAAWGEPEFAEADAPLLSVGYRTDSVDLWFYTTITTFAQPLDQALEGLRIECSFPADTATATACQALLR